MNTEKKQPNYWFLSASGFFNSDYETTNPFTLELNVKPGDYIISIPDCLNAAGTNINVTKYKVNKYYQIVPVKNKFESREITLAIIAQSKKINISKLPKKEKETKK